MRELLPDLAALERSAVFAALSIPFVLKFVRETKGKTLEEMG
ncbi:hypothetical protein [Streptomyces sp. NPDC090994]